MKQIALPTLLITLFGFVTIASGSDSLAAAATFSHPTPTQPTTPHVPEPMVFDLVRPLGAKKGEFEVNTLALIPFNRRLTGSSRSGDELGQTPLSADRGLIEWAPEIEFTLWDGFALEFEFPFEGSVLEEIKTAAQWTAGTALGGRFIHGFQAIFERARQSTTSTWTGVWIGAMRFSPRWSLLGMSGASHEVGGGIDDIGGNRTQILQNLNLFCNLTDQFHLGLESNYAVSLDGNSTLLLMPQLQFDLGNHLSVQLGAGIGLSESETLPQAAVRVIWTF
jgi:hypothetical protein